MNSIKICGMIYTIVYKSSAEMNGTLGLADFNKQEISINSEITQQSQNLALYHEVLHIIDMAYNLKLSHEQVTFASHAILALVNDNPELKL